MIRIVAVGKRHDADLQAAIEGYQKRLKPPYEVEWQLLPHSPAEGERARDEESGRLLAKLEPPDYVLLLDERGRLLDNTGLAERLAVALEASRRVVIIIGGAYGVDEALRRRADVIWSLSPLILPHQLVRLVLIEQLYRTQALSQGHPYHHV